MKVGDVWSFMSNLLFFRYQAIQIDPTIDYIIAIPIWVGIAVSVIYLVDKLLKNWL